MSDIEEQILAETNEYLSKVESGEIKLTPNIAYDAFSVVLEGFKERISIDSEYTFLEADPLLLQELADWSMKLSAKEKAEKCIELAQESSLSNEAKSRLSMLFTDSFRDNFDIRIGVTVRNNFRELNGLSPEDANRLIRSLIAVHEADEASVIYDVARFFPGVDKEPNIKGIGLAAASTLLHCTNPSVFVFFESVVRKYYEILCSVVSSNKAFQNRMYLWNYLDFSKAMHGYLQHEYPEIKNTMTLYNAGCSEKMQAILTSINEENNTFDNPSQEFLDTEKGLGEEMSLNQILYGPPGTGKTYSTVNIAVQICDPIFFESNSGEDEESYGKRFKRYTELVEQGRIVFTTFHQSFGYEDFIEGIRPDLGSQDGVLRYKLHDGIFKTLCNAARGDKFNNYVIVIDEINRGNVSRIFGELITLLEESKREGADEQRKAILPYSDDPFGVPKNVYLLGTMNTADRSLTQLDTALRRRFDFIEIMPDSTKLGTVETGEGVVELVLLLEAINERIENLYDREHMIGHSYLMKVDSLEGLKTAFEKKIIPLLQEYFYDDYSKIQAVLGNEFVKSKDGEKSYQLTLPKDWTTEAFIEIYRENTTEDTD